MFVTGNVIPDGKYLNQSGCHKWHSCGSFEPPFSVMPLPDKPTVPETNDHPSPSCVESKAQDLPNMILSSEEERKLWQKIDIRLLPIISFMYLWSFMDRGE